MSERTWDLVRNKGRPSKHSALPQAPGGAYDFDPNDEFDERAIRWWIQFADFYEWPHIRTFDSFDDLLRQLADPALDLEQISRDAPTPRVPARNCVSPLEARDGAPRASLSVCGGGPRL